LVDSFESNDSIDKELLDMLFMNQKVWKKMSR